MYADEVDVQVESMLTGEHTDIESLEDLRNSGIGVIREWANDNDLQYLRVCSTNIGFIRTYQKRFKRQAARAAGGE